MKIGLVFGSTTGNTQDVAERILEEFIAQIDEALDIDVIDIERLLEFDVLLVGIPTWDVGGLQDSWEYCARKLPYLGFDGKRVAFFGQGDQSGYPDNFQDAMGILRTMFIARGAIANIGHWSTEGYEFTESRGVVAGKFVGLALDEHNQSELTNARIAAWCAQLKRELSLS